MRRFSPATHRVPAARPYRSGTTIAYIIESASADARRFEPRAAATPRNVRPCLDPQPPIASVVLIEDHLIVRDGLRALLSMRRDLRIVGEAADGAQGLALIDACRPELALVDLNLPALDGVEVIARAKASTSTKCIVLTSDHDDERAKRAIAAGADAFLLKTCSRAELYATIDHVLRHDDPLARLVADEHPTSPVTAAELRVLFAIKAGKTNEQIARELNISLNTVKTHVAHLFRKLGAGNRTSALGARADARLGLKPRRRRTPRRLAARPQNHSFGR
jgi:DNA-binding NarL/FixJ family response regulator